MGELFSAMPLRVEDAAAFHSLKAVRSEPDLTLKTCSGDGFAVSRFANEHIHRVLRDGIESAGLRYHLRDQQKRLHHHPTKFQLKDAELEIKNVRRVMESNRGKLATLVHAEKFPSATQTAN